MSNLDLNITDRIATPIIRKKGIDPKARGTELHGRVLIEMFDGITGKKTDEVRHDNFFTDALDSILNKCPWGCDRVELGGGTIRGTDYQTNRIFETLLGGIMLFPDSLGNDPSDLYPNFASNLPTAYASMMAYETADRKQGSFNSVESGAVNNGYKYVYDWSTSNGNGPIAAVALSHKYCYNHFNNGIR